MFYISIIVFYTHEYLLTHSLKGILRPHVAHRVATLISRSVNRICGAGCPFCVWDGSKRLEGMAENIEARVSTDSFWHAQCMFRVDDSQSRSQCPVTYS